MIYHIVYILVIYRLNMDGQKTTYRKTYDRQTKTYHYISNDPSMSFYAFRAGFGGYAEWTAGRGDIAFGFPTLNTAIVEMMGWDDYQIYMANREVA